MIFYVSEYGRVALIVLQRSKIWNETHRGRSNDTRSKIEEEGKLLHHASPPHLVVAEQNSFHCTKERETHTK